MSWYGLFEHYHAPPCARFSITTQGKKCIPLDRRRPTFEKLRSASCASQTREMTWASMVVIIPTTLSTTMKTSRSSEKGCLLLVKSTQDQQLCWSTSLKGRGVELNRLRHEVRYWSSSFIRTLSGTLCLSSAQIPCDPISSWSWQLGGLALMVEPDPAPSLETIRKWFSLCLSASDYMYIEKCTVHRDIKPETSLMNGWSAFCEEVARFARLTDELMWWVTRCKSLSSCDEMKLWFSRAFELLWRIK